MMLSGVVWDAEDKDKRNSM